MSCSENSRIAPIGSLQRCWQIFRTQTACAYAETHPCSAARCQPLHIFSCHEVYSLLGEAQLSITGNFSHFANFALSLTSKFNLITFNVPRNFVFANIINFKASIQTFLYNIGVYNILRWKISMDGIPYQPIMFIEHHSLLLK